MGWKWKDPDAVFNHYFDTVVEPYGHTQGVYEEDDLAHGKSFRSPGSLGNKAVSSRITALREYDNALNYDKNGIKKPGSGPFVDLGVHKIRWNRVQNLEAKADELQDRAEHNIIQRNAVSCPRAAAGAIFNRIDDEMDKHK